MAKRETNIWVSVRNGFQRDLQMQRLTDRLEGGLPDVLWKHLSSPRVGLFELKVEEDNTEWVRPDQALWLRNWVGSTGGKAGVLSKAGKLWRWYPADNSYSWVMSIQDRRHLPPCVESPRLAALVHHIVFQNER